MSFPNNLTDSELQAVNQILSSVGQSPVTTLESGNPDAVMAYNSLMEANREVQSEGWFFNREYSYELLPDNDGHIIIGDDMLMVTLSREYQNAGSHVCVRDGKLYDMVSHSYDWELGVTVPVDIIWLYDFNDIPQVAKNFVMARAATILSTRLIGDSETYRLLSAREVTTRLALVEVDASMGQYTSFGFKQGNNFYNSYQPLQVLQRY